MASANSQLKHSLCLEFECPDGHFLGFFEEDEVLALQSKSPFFRECIEASVSDAAIRRIRVLTSKTTIVQNLIQACIDGSVQLLGGTPYILSCMLVVAEEAGTDLRLCNMVSTTEPCLHKEEIPHLINLWDTSRELVLHTAISPKQWRLCLEKDILLMPERSDNIVLVIPPACICDGDDTVPASCPDTRPRTSSNFVFHLHTKGLGLTDAIMCIRHILKSDCDTEQHDQVVVSNTDEYGAQAEKFSMRVTRGKHMGSRTACLHEHIYQGLKENSWLSAPCSVLKDLLLAGKQRKKNAVKIIEFRVEFQVAHPTPDTLGRFLYIAAKTSVQVEMLLESNVFRCFGNMTTIAYIIQYMADYSQTVGIPPNDFAMVIRQGTIV